ncbi:phage baseplate plug family protein [Bordetella genomosp. 11]|uniref:Cyanophage baseplate Pam3 plug gp18 domain-containing protein n=1 Tax=Bordetella genomosp. 11 TaxID=1416808 RepID=A0A261UDF0_9BORD|nr:hypothetical protein [Bordetella genomosp. 11]OZI59948.1 hypothetical protein CAL28_10720 [Bordetella genomosp. 11]
MMIIPLQAVPSQALSVVLGGQNCQINVYQKSTGLFLDLYVNNAPIITAALCLDRVRLVRTTYQGFIGDLAVADTLSTSDPSYEGLGTRFQLLYLESTDL